MTAELDVLPAEPVADFSDWDNGAEVSIVAVTPMQVIPTMGDVVDILGTIAPSASGSLRVCIHTRGRAENWDRAVDVVITTPNSEYNVRYPALAEVGYRHPDHRFEWTREQFAAWTRSVGQAHGYEVAVRPVGDFDPQVGSPTQMAVFTSRTGSGDAV